jgi:hypothetical protein
LLGGGLVAGAVGHFTSPVILGLGAVAFIFGMFGCWWLLAGMRTGRFQPTLRKLLLGVAFFPVLTGLLWLISIVPLTRGLTDVIYSRQPVPLLWVILPFAVAVIGGRFLWRFVALPGSGDPLPRSRRITPVVGTVVLLLSLLAAKHLHVTLSLLRQHVGLEYQIYQSRPFRPLNDEDAALVKEAARKATGEDGDFYRIEFPPTFQSIAPHGSPTPTGAMGVEFVVSHPRDAKEYSDAFDQRLRALIPSRIKVSPCGGGFRSREIRNAERTTLGVFGSALVIFLGTASLLLIFSGKKAFVVSLATGAAATVVLSAVSMWPTPAFLPPSLGERPALPALPGLGKDFSTAELMLDFLINAAKRKDRDSVLEAFEPGTLSETDLAALPQMMKILSNCDLKPPDIYEEKAYLNVFVKRYGNQANFFVGYPVPIVSRNGEWRIHGDLSSLIRQMIVWDRDAEFIHD